MPYYFNNMKKYVPLVTYGDLNARDLKHNMDYD